MTPRGVAAYVESVLGPALEQRRALIREASEQGLQTFPNEPIESSVHSKPSHAAPHKPSEHPSAAPTAREIPIGTPAPAPQVPPQVEAPPIAPGEIEHRRMRALLAAAMLLLVGSAVGLLLARSSGGGKTAPEKPVPTGAATR